MTILVRTEQFSSVRCCEDIRTLIVPKQNIEGGTLQRSLCPSDNEGSKSVKGGGGSVVVLNQV